LEAAGSFVQEYSPLFVPSWFQTILSVEADGIDMPVEWITDEYFVPATKIVLRPHDSAFYHVDAKQELEDALTRYGVLQQGTTILVRLEALQGFSVAFDVIHLEPANMVLMEGDEVAIDFEEALDAATVPVAPVVQESFPDEMLPLKQDEGQKTGGITHPPLADGRPWNPWR
jgi:hypothetical protein